MSLSSQLNSSWTAEEKQDTLEISWKTSQLWSVHCNRINSLRGMVFLFRLTNLTPGEFPAHCKVRIINNPNLSLNKHSVYNLHNWMIKIIAAEFSQHLAIKKLVKDWTFCCLHPKELVNSKRGYLDTLSQRLSCSKSLEYQCKSWVDTEFYSLTHSSTKLHLRELQRQILWYQESPYYFQAHT